MALRTVLPGGREREAKLLETGARVVAPGDAEYPRLLREIPRPPGRLWLRGRPLTAAPAVAVVGARRASRAGLAAARHLAGGLAGAGVVIVSGFARGIDAAAHRAALEVGGTTVAVFGCGLDVCYPAEHAALLQAIVAGGTAMSEFDPGERPLPYYFPIRNRIIAGLSRLVLVVEAAEKSGSLITARRLGPRRRGGSRSCVLGGVRRIERPTQGRRDSRPERGGHPLGTGRAVAGPARDADRPEGVRSPSRP
jgi:DNA protecting protein DprA